VTHLILSKIVLGKEWLESKCQCVITQTVLGRVKASKIRQFSHRTKEFLMEIGMSREKNGKVITALLLNILGLEHFLNIWCFDEKETTYFKQLT